jgi:hypothetical protein
VPHQPPLKLTVADANSPSLLALVNELLKANGPPRKIVADQLGCSESHLSEVLAGHKHLPEAWLRFIAKNYDPDHRIATLVASWQGCRAVALRRVSDAAFRRAAERWMAAGNGVGAAARAEILALAAEEPETDVDLIGGAA